MIASRRLQGDGPAFRKSQIVFACISGYSGKRFGLSIMIANLIYGTGIGFETNAGIHAMFWN